MPEPAGPRAPSSGSPDPNRHLELARAAGLLDFHFILQSMNVGHILGIARIDQCSHANQHITGADFFLGQDMGACAVIDLGRILISIDHLHRHEALARIGQRDRNRPGSEVEDCGGIQRVAVQPDDGLVVDRGRFPAMDEFTEAAVFDDIAEVEIALCAREVVRRNGDAVRRLRMDAPTRTSAVNSATAVRPSFIYPTSRKESICQSPLCAAELGP